MDDVVEIRQLAPHEFGRVAEIDRTERIEVLLTQQGTELVPRTGVWDVPPWDPEGEGDHSVAAHRRALVDFASAGGVTLGAIAEGRLVGVGVVVPRHRPGIARLAYLHVSSAVRDTGIGTRLVEELERIARRTGADEMVVTATPSEHTVRFYLGRGYQPMATPLPELLAEEPEDVHLGKLL